MWFFVSTIIYFVLHIIDHGVCVCAFVPSRVVPPRSWGQATSMTAKSTHAILDHCVLGAGHRTMVSPGTYQGFSPAEVLQTSQGRKSVAHRLRKANRAFMRVGTWNIRSMVDTEGPIEVASQRFDGQRGEDRKVHGSGGI